MDDLEFLLDNQLEFNLPVEDGTVVFDGSVMQAVGSRVVVAIPENELVSQPEGMNLSPGGFYYFYVGNNGSGENSFKREVAVNPAVERGFVSAFVRRWYSVGDIKVKLRGCISEKYIFILGSCVSRDAFPSSRNLAGYRARTSYSTFSSAPLDPKVFQTNSMSSAFQRRMVDGDLTKDAVRLAAGSAGEAILVDFVDERYPTVPFNGTIVTLSDEFNSLVPKDWVGEERIEFGSDKYFANFLSGWATFITGTVNKRVVINKTHWATKDETGKQFSNQDFISQINAYLDRLYTIVAAASPRCEWIEYSDRDLVANTAHEWGLSPYHYVERYYETQRKQLRALGLL